MAYRDFLPRRRRRTCPAGWVAAVCVLAAASAAAQPPPKVDPSPELARLHFQLGTWHAVSKTLDKSGKVVRTRENRVEITLAHRGLLILHRYQDPEFEQTPYRIWQFHGRYDGVLHDVSFDIVGHFEHRVEVDNDGSLAFAFAELRAFQDGVPRNWRKTYSEITPDSYRQVWDYTEDGETWIKKFDARFERITADGRPADDG